MASKTYELGPGSLSVSGLGLAGKEHEIKGITLTLVDPPEIPTCAPVQPQSKEWAREIQAEFSAAKDLRALMRAGTVLHALRYAPEVQQMCMGPFNSRVEALAPGIAGKRVVAVDLSAIYHAAFSVCEGKPETTKHVLQMLRNLYSETKPNHFIIALDSKRNWRKDAYADYKADRPSKPRNFGEFLKEVIVELKSKNVQAEEHEGYESDDVMASIAYRAKLLKQEVILVSEDKDLWQCLGGKVQQFRFRSDHKEYRDATWLSMNHRITPRQAVDWLCLVGKNNVKGAEKIGEKRASEYLEKYGSFFGLYEAREELTEKQRESVEEFMTRYWDTRKLHMLNVELDVFWN